MQKFFNGIINWITEEVLILIIRKVYLKMPGFILILWKSILIMRIKKEHFMASTFKMTDGTGEVAKG